MITAEMRCDTARRYIFRELADPADFDAEYYLPYARGFNLTRRMPLFVRPRRKLRRADVHALLSSKYEGSELDPSLDGVPPLVATTRHRPGAH